MFSFLYKRAPIYWANTNDKLSQNDLYIIKNNKSYFSKQKMLNMNEKLNLFDPNNKEMQSK